MFNQVIFYNHFGAGDIFESRNFVKEWMRLVPSQEYFYSHGKNEGILLDIEGLKFKSITPHMKPMSAVWNDLNGNLYVNTWIGRNGKYVLPGIGCTVEKLYEMHNDMLSVHYNGVLSGTPIDYIPDIDYSKYRIDGVDKFMSKHKEDKIFIDNGVVQSNQAANFEFNSIIIELALLYKDKCFITSQPIETSLKNIHSVNTIIKSDGWGFDLNELSYTSTFCSTLIGRNSGPHVFSQVKSNVMNPSKKLLSFTYESQGASFVVNSQVEIRRYWSDSTDKDSVLSKIQEVINE